MRGTKSKIRCGGMLAILVLLLGQVASAAQSLTVNGEAIDAITLKAGQVCTVEIISDDSNSYSAYVGFDDCVVLGNFYEPLKMPEAGDLASIIEYDEPSFCGYYVEAAGKPPGPSPGVHFTILYKPKDVGETELKLYDQSLTSVIDSLHITVVPAWMGTVFTYQGRLMESGNPADGHYDFEFILYNAPSYGSQLAGTVESGDMDVINGYFTTELDFGSDVFNGDAVWLQISVRPGDSNDPNAFINLSPRQEITPSPYSLQTRGIFVDNSGNVGIGKKLPDKKLTVSYGDFAVYPGQSEPSIITDGHNVKLGDPDGMRNQVFLEIDDLTEKFVFNNGNIGIGTTSPHALLDIANPADGPAMTVGRRSGNASIAASEGASGGWLIMDSNGAGKVGLNYYHDGDIILANGGGKVGISDTSPDAKLSIQMPEGWPLSLSEVGGLEIKDSLYNVGDQLVVRDSSGNCRFVVDGAGRVGIGEENPTRELTVRGNILIESAGTGEAVVELGEGLDYAEGFNVSEQGDIQPGTVLVIDSDNPGRLTVSRQAYDRRVAGIAAGAGGVGSGVRLGVSDFDCDVALAGRVYCKVDAGKAAVEAGDLLTTSHKPGYAMKALDSQRAQGAILGKAMEKLEKGQAGWILVLVTLQ